MTLIVGIKCKNAVVMGADGAATLGSTTQMTVTQEVKKIAILRGCIIVAVSGYVGLAQRLREVFEREWDRNNKFKDLSPGQAMQILRARLWEIVEPEMHAAKVSKDVVGAQAAIASAVCFSMVALPMAKAPRLFQFNHQCSPEEATEDLPFVAIGSGQFLADPFLAFIRRIYWEKGLPSVGEGLFAAQWTLQHAAGVATGGISPPFQFAVLESQGDGVWRARLLDENEMNEHKQNIASAEEALANYFKGTQPTDAPPEPPHGAAKPA